MIGRRAALLLALALLAPSACGPPADQIGAVLGEAIRAYWRESFHAPSEHMAPSLLPGDMFFVDKRAYSVRDPMAGDVVIYEAARVDGRMVPADQHPDAPREKFVSRVIAVPGDSISVRGGRVFVNGNPLPEVPLEESYVDQGSNACATWEQVVGARAFRIARRIGMGEKDLDAMQVGEDRYFLMGDYRNNSNDSRYWGSVHRDQMIGPVTIVYLSQDPATEEWRWSRVGHEIR